MSIFTIADLHLSYSEPKPMDIFGNNWKNHEEKIKKNWIKNVNENDLVVLPGDFSWAMYLEETKKDFEFLNGIDNNLWPLKDLSEDKWERYSVTVVDGKCSIPDGNGGIITLVRQ